ncbi:MAG: hypothetical protein ABIJ39_03375 [Chloroflexota bacterium]
MISTVVQNCLTVQNEISPPAEIDGALVIDNTFDAYLLDIDTHSVQPFQIDETYDQNTFSHYSRIDVSPDGQKLVYTAVYIAQDGQVNERMMLMTANGQYYDLMFWSIEQGYFLGWFDNDRILLSWNDRPYGTITLLNVNTGQSEEISPTFADLYPEPVYDPVYDRTIYLINPVTWFPVLYDRTLSRAFLYLSDSNGMRYVLWNTETREILWERRVYSPRVEPQWSPDGEQLIVTMRPDPLNSIQEEFYTISRDGEEIQLTDLLAIYSSFFIGTYSWSPDGEFLAFWLGSGLIQPQPRLAVLNMRRGMITDYCLGPGGIKPIWSPDGKQVVISIRGNREPGVQSSVVIVDIEQNTAYKVTDILSIAGWMSTNDGADNP